MTTNGNPSTDLDLNDIPQILTFQMGQAENANQPVVWVRLIMSNEHGRPAELVISWMEVGVALRLSQGILNTALDLLPSLPPLEEG